MLFDQASKGRGSNDILMKAWDYGMKIWALEKLQRVLNGLLDLPINHGSLGISVTRRGQSIQSFKEPTQGTLDLSHLLKNERLHGPTDRDPNATSKDLIHFKGPFVYVYDLFSQNRPTMVRDYPKAPRREDGTWPQFRSVSSGKCPFIEESVHQRREKDRGRERERLKAKEAKEAELLKAQGKVVEKVKEIVEIQDIAVNIPARRSASVESRASTNSKRPPPIPLYRRSISRQENTVAFTATNQQAPGRYTHEPAASGVQPSHITSAIRSHNVSSHQDQPGTRAGMSKEIYGLQRKVAGNVLLGNPRGPSLIARQLLEPAAPAMETRRRATENSMRAPQSAAAVKKPAKKPDPKPGYCENCRDKFDDFEDVGYQWSAKLRVHLLTCYTAHQIPEAPKVRYGYQELAGTRRITRPPPPASEETSTAIASLCKLRRRCVNKDGHHPCPCATTSIIIPIIVSLSILSLFYCITFSRVRGLQPKGCEMAESKGNWTHFLCA